MFRSSGAVSSGYATPSTSKINPRLLSPPPLPEKKKKMESNQEEFKDCSLQQLQRTCIIHQLKAAIAQERAAKEMEEYYRSKNRQRILRSTVYDYDLVEMNGLDQD